MIKWTQRIDLANGSPMTQFTVPENLSKWYFQNHSEASEDALTECARAYFQLLYTPPKSSRWEIYLIPLTDLLEHSADGLEDLHDIYHFLGAKDFDLEEFITAIAEQAAREEYRPLFGTLSKLAKLSQHPPFQFLAGWYALNLGMLNECVLECRKASNPSSKILTLQGQAELEAGKVTSAIGSLQKSTQLSPQDPLTWFQLAKAYFVNDSLEMAWDSLLVCRNLIPESQEIPAFMAQIASCEEPKNPHKLQQSWTALTAADFSNSNINYIECLLNLSFSANKQEWAKWVVDHCDVNAFLQPKGLKVLPGILKELNDRSWRHVSTQLLKSLDLPESV